MGVRDMSAVIKFSRPPKWKKQPVFSGSKANARNILVTGATGFIGQSLCRTLLKNGDNITVLSRQYEKAENLFGPHVKIVTSLEEIESSDQFDGIISLAGASLIAGLWTKTRKKLLIDSRLNDLKSIKALCERLKKKPDVLINASAIGFYGIRQDEFITEKDEGQNIFQSELCQARENAALVFKEYGTRICNLRIGIVFDNDGGAFPSMARPIKYGVGAILGNGQQWMSWVYKPDLLRIMLFLLSQEHISGAINATAPEPVRNEVFTKKVATKFNKPVLFRFPASLLKMMLGELSQLFVEGQRVMPEKLLNAGFRFNQGMFDEMLSAISGEENLNADETIKVYYNEQCPVCNREVSQYKRSASSNKCSMEFNDINKNEDILSMYQLSYADIKRRMYVHDERGNLVSGLDAFLTIWGALPEYRGLSRVFKMPVIYQFGDILYEYVFVPCRAFFNDRRNRK